MPASDIIAKLQAEANETADMVKALDVLSLAQITLLTRPRVPGSWIDRLAEDGE